MTEEITTPNILPALTQALVGQLETADAHPDGLTTRRLAEAQARTALQLFDIAPKGTIEALVEAATLAYIYFVRLHGAMMVGGLHNQADCPACIARKALHAALVKVQEVQP